MSSSDIITHIKEYNKELKEHQNVSILDDEKYLSLFSKLETIKVSNNSVQDRQKQLADVQKEFDELYKKNQVNKSDYDKKMKDIKQRELAYINTHLSKNADTNTIIDVLKSGVLDYKYAVGLIKNNDDIKQKIRDGKYVIARKGNRVALIATDKEIIGYKQELTNFLQQQDNATISNVILSNVPVYNNGSHVLSFDKDKQDLSDDVLKIYFSVENDSNINFVADARKMELYSNVAEDITKRLIDYQQNTANGKKINLHAECSSYGIYPLLTGLLKAKQGDVKQCLSLYNCCVDTSILSRSILNGITPEAIAEKIYELFQLAVADGYNIKNANIPFVNLDVLSNDRAGRFEYHNVGSTDSFLKELSRLMTIYNNGCSDADKQTLFVAVNEETQPESKKDSGIIDKIVSFAIGTAKQDLFKNIANGDGAYSGIVVKTMSDLADEISRKNTMQNNIAGISKNNKDGVLHTVNSDKTVNNSFVKSVVDDKTVQKI